MSLGVTGPPSSSVEDGLVPDTSHPSDAMTGMVSSAIARIARVNVMITFPDAGSRRTLRATRPPLERCLSTPAGAGVERACRFRHVVVESRPKARPPMLNALIAALLLPSPAAPPAGDWGNA